MFEVFKRTNIKKNLKIIIIVFIIVYALYMFIPIHVKLTEIAQVNTGETLKGTWWTVITDNTQSIIKKYNIPISQVDFNEYYVLISAGREISSMTYTRWSKHDTFYEGTYLGREIFKRKLYEHTIFVYKIKKVHIISDEQAGLPSTLRFEK